MNKKTESALTKRIKKNAEETLKKLFDEKFLNSMSKKQEEDFIDSLWELMFALCVQVETLGYSSEVFAYKAVEAVLQGKEKNKAKLPLDKHGQHYVNNSQKH